MKKERLREKVVESWEKVVKIRRFGVDEIFRYEMENFVGSFGERNEEGNLSVEMCSDELFLEHALDSGNAYCFHQLLPHFPQYFGCPNILKSDRVYGVCCRFFLSINQSLHGLSARRCPMYPHFLTG